MSHRERDPRYRVHLQVRFGVARDFVVEYAENLSKGGLFVRGAHNLEPLEDVTIQIELPGAGAFEVTGRVAHILDAATAEKVGRKPGAGLQLLDSPPGFVDALGAYLVRLGRRRDATALATRAEARGLLEVAGYRSEQAEPPEAIVQQIARCELPVVGVVVDRAQEAAYRAAMAAAGDEGLVRAIDYLEELEALLPELDDDIPGL
jgi:Tfp pilus assembly protein PilZ